jgi:GDP-4-dehydro-6-deoxy-D-mannose reductase
MPIALVTGIRGFVGTHLSTHLSQRGWQVYGFDQRMTRPDSNVFIGDMGNTDAFQSALSECQPDIIFHLAGLIKSAQQEKLYQANLLGTVALFESLIRNGQRPMVVVASSSAVYGAGFGGRPITETFKPRPLTHYAVSKLAQESVTLRYFDAFQLPVAVARIFNLLGPGQSPDLACSVFARQIAQAESSGEEEIVTGDLSARRDFVDVRDAVRALALLAETGKAGQIYNVCSGRAVLIRKCLTEMIAMSPRRLTVRVDSARFQKHDVPVQVGNGKKLHRASGWRPQIHLKQSLSDLLEYWRQRVKSELE